MSSGRWRRAITRWGRKGFASVLDQGAFAVANFALNILMARWLRPEVYGLFAVAHTLFLLAATAYAGLLIEPLLIFGASEYRKESRRYLGSVLHLHVYYGAAAFVLFLGGALVARAVAAGPLPGALVAVAFATPFMLILWIGRKACYLWLEPWRAAKGGMVYLLLLLPAAYVLHKLGWLGPASALLLMGGASLVAGGGLLRGLGPREVVSPDRERLRAVVRDHWSYGRWAASTRLLNWLPGHVYFLLLPIWVSIEATGSLRALLNLLNPLVHTYAAVTVLFMTVLVRLRQDGRFDRAMQGSLGLFTLAAIAFWLCLGLFGEAVVGFLYSGKYVGDASLLWILGAVPLLNGLTAFMTAGLRALEEPEKVFYIYLGATAVALLVGLPLMRSRGLGGAAWGLVASGAASALIAAVTLVRTRRTVWSHVRGEPVGSEV